MPKDVNQAIGAVNKVIEHIKSNKLQNQVNQKGINLLNKVLDSLKDYDREKEKGKDFKKHRW